MNACDVEVEGDDGNRVDEMLNEAFGSRARDRAGQPMKTVQQLRYGHRGHRDRLVIVGVAKLLRIELTALDDNDDAGYRSAFPWVLPYPWSVARGRRIFRGLPVSLIGVGQCREQRLEVCQCEGGTIDCRDPGHRFSATFDHIGDPLLTNAVHEPAEILRRVRGGHARLRPSATTLRRSTHIPYVTEIESAGQVRARRRPDAASTESCQ